MILKDKVVLRKIQMTSLIAIMYEAAGKVQSLKHTFTFLSYTGKFLLPTHILSLLGEAEDI